MKKTLKIPYVPFGLFLDLTSLLLWASRETRSLPGGVREARGGPFPGTFAGPATTQTWRDKPPATEGPRTSTPEDRLPTLESGLSLDHAW
jgi:hypothetical protein